MITRRQFLQRLGLIAAGRILLPTDDQLRRFWALDKTMVERPGNLFSQTGVFLSDRSSFDFTPAYPVFRTTDGLLVEPKTVSPARDGAISVTFDGEITVKSILIAPFAGQVVEFDFGYRHLYKEDELRITLT